MPNSRLPDIEEVPSYEASGLAGHGDMVASASRLRGSSRLGGSARELDSDYYLGGYDIDSDFPPPHEEEFLTQDQLPPPLPTPLEEYQEHPYDTLPATQPASKESTLSGSGSGSTGRHRSPRPHFHPSQYLPPHQLPLGEAGQGGPGGEEFSTFVGRVITPGGGDMEDNVSLNMRLSVNASSASDLSAPCGFDDSEAGGSDFDSTDELHRGGTYTVEMQQQTEV